MLNENMLRYNYMCDMQKLNKTTSGPVFASCTVVYTFSIKSIQTD